MQFSIISNCAYFYYAQNADENMNVHPLQKVKIRLHKILLVSCSPIPNFPEWAGGGFSLK